MQPRFVQTGRDWTTTSNARANTERRTDRMAMDRNDRRDLRWCAAIAIVLTFLFAYLAGVRWS